MKDGKEPDYVTIQPGSELGTYTILAPVSSPGDPTDSAIGEGVVWRAAAAKSLSALDHPNIARVYGLEEPDQTVFLVTEPADGDTLTDRLKRGPIPVVEGLGLGLQIAQGLEAAHASGILHRDLNPSNIRIAPDGSIKIVDFGLATLLGPDDAGPGSDVNLSHSPTLSVTATGSGSFSGTSAYLAPEQARGDAPEAGADIWGFGCVLCSRFRSSWASRAC